MSRSRLQRSQSALVGLLSSRAISAARSAVDNFAPAALPCCGAPPTLTKADWVAYGRKVKSRVIKFCHSKGIAEEAEYDDIPTASDAAHYRGLAHGLRELARQCRIARARLELVQLAIKFEQRAARLEQGRR